MVSGMAASRAFEASALADLIRSRRSIDLFDPTPVGVDVLLEGIELARWAPNHRLTQPWKFYIVGPETKEALARFAAEFDTKVKGERAGVARYARLSAIPAMFVLTSRRSADELTDREDYAACCCAAQNLMLYLWQRGVGVKWTTGAFTREQKFYELLGIDPEHERVVGLFWYGRPQVVPAQKRREVQEIVVERP